MAWLLNQHPELHGAPGEEQKQGDGLMFKLRPYGLGSPCLPPLLPFLFPTSPMIARTSSPLPLPASCPRLSVA